MKSYFLNLTYKTNENKKLNLAIILEIKLAKRTDSYLFLRNNKVLGFFIKVRQCQRLQIIMTNMSSKPMNDNCNELDNITACWDKLCPAIWKHRPRDNRYSRWCSGKTRHPCLKQTSPKHKGVFANKDEINHLKDCKLVQKDASNNCDNEPTKLGHYLGKILDT